MTGSPSRRAGVVAAAALALALLAAGCGAPAARRPARVPITVARAETRTVPFEIDATGTVDPIQSAAITSQVGGLIQRVALHEGDEVQAGQVLFEIDPRPFEAALAQANGVLARDRAQAEGARLDYERAVTLADQHLISAGELDQKRATSQAANATVRADSAGVIGARLNLAYATVRAPIAGKTGSLLVHLGDMVKANETASPLLTINQLRPIRVKFTVTQSEFAELRRQRHDGARVEVAPSDRDSAWVDGRLVFVDNQVDPGSGTVLLKGEFDNGDGALWPGQFVRVRLRLYEQRDATVVPAAAVTSSQSGSYCYVVKADTTVEARPVTVQRTWRDLAVLASGVRPGETVVTDGQLRLTPGAKATIRHGPATGSGG